MERLCKLLVSVALLGSMSLSVSAFDFEVDGIYYTVKSETDFTVYVSRKASSGGEGCYSGDVVIPAQITKYGQTYRVVGIESMAFMQCYSLYSISIPSSIETIEFDWSTFECNQLRNFYVDEANPAFKSVDGVLFSKDGEVLHEYPMGKTDAEYTIPDGVKRIGTFAFGDSYNYHYLAKVNMPNSVVRIDDKAFHLCYCLASINLSSSLEYIGDSAFDNCHFITELTLPEGLKHIGKDAFWGTSLTSVNIPSSVTEWNVEDGFGVSETLREINVGDGNPLYASIDGILFSKDKTRLIQCPQGKELGWYTIPEHVETICYKAFWDNANLTRVVIPATVDTICVAAFYGCNNLNRVTCYSEEPPVIPYRSLYSDQSPFSSSISNATLYVPQGSKNKYYNVVTRPAYDAGFGKMYPWRNFKEIIEMDETAIDGIRADDIQNATFYSVNGRKEDSPKSGIYIQKRPDGTAKKILVR